MLAYECGISELFVDVFIGLKSSKDITVPGNVDNFSFGSALLILPSNQIYQLHDYI